VRAGREDGEEERGNGWEEVMNTWWVERGVWSGSEEMMMMIVMMVVLFVSLCENVRE